MADRWATVFRGGGIGDDLITSSVLPGLRARYGRVEVITREPFGVVFENNPHIDRLVMLPAEDVAIDALAWQLKWAERAKESAFFVNLSHSCEVSLAYLKGQTQFWWPVEARRKLSDKSYLAMVHDICGLPHEFAPRFYATDNEKAQAKGVVRDQIGRGAPVVGWCLSGSRIDKVYPYSHIAIARIIRELGATVVMLGAPGPNHRMATDIHNYVVQANGGAVGLHTALSPDAENPSWPIRRVLAQAQACNVVVTPDTGPAWAVAMEPNVAKVVLLSHASAKNITTGWLNTKVLHADEDRVPCWPCHRLHDDWSTCVKASNVEAASCMADISVEKLVQSVALALGAQKEKSNGERVGLRRETAVGLHQLGIDRDAPDCVGAGAIDGGADRLIPR